MVSEPDNTIDPLWSSRKLLILYTLLNQKSTFNLPLTNLITPSNYPRNVITKD